DDVLQGLQPGQEGPAVPDLHISGHRPHRRIGEVGSDAHQEVGGGHRVGVEDDDDVAGGPGDPGVEGAGLALLRLADHPAGKGGGDVGGAVGGSVVDDDDLQFGSAGLEAGEAGQRLGEDPGLVVGGDDDAEPQAGGRRRQGTAAPVAGLDQG